MPELTEIKGKIDIDGLICSFTLNQALKELERYREEGDDVSAGIMLGMIDGLIGALEPIEE